MFLASNIVSSNNICTKLCFRPDSEHVDMAEIFPALKTVNIKKGTGFRGQRQFAHLAKYFLFIFNTPFTKVANYDTARTSKKQSSRNIKQKLSVFDIVTKQIVLTVTY